MTSVKTIRAACFAVVLCMATSAQAQTIDLSTFKCKEFVESPADRMIYILLWLDGYFTGEDDEPVINFDDLKGIGAKLRTYCAANPDMDVITAAEEVFGN